MSKRRRKRRRRQRSGGGGSGAAAVSTAASKKKKKKKAAPEEKATASGKRARIVPWRETVRGLLDALRGYARQHHGDVLEQALEHAFGSPPAPPHPTDADRLVDDLACAAGSAGDRSILRAFCEDATHVDAEARAQALRWETERRRGVFLVQRCFADRMDLWDPLEGAGLTLALLDKLPAGRAAEVRRGAVMTCTYLPYQARLIAVGAVEIYGDERAVRMFRDEVRSSGQVWHDAPPPAPRSS